MTMDTTLDCSDKPETSHSFRNATATFRATPARFWTGVTLSGLGAAFLLFDAGIKLATIQPVIDSFARLGYPAEFARGIGLLELGCLALYLARRTAIVGALLLTGFLGGAISTHLRVADPWLSHTLFPLYVALLLWGGLYLRDARTRALLRASAR
jgi:hypothetical protein